MLALRVAAFLALLGVSLAFFLQQPISSSSRHHHQQQPRAGRAQGQVRMLNLFGGGAKAKGGAGTKKKTFTITVQQQYYKDAELTVEAGAPVNLRKELMKNKIDIYPLQGKIYNCGGGGQCGTCAVKVVKGMQNLNPKSPVETKALGGKDKPDLRLSCCSRASGDVTVKTKP